MERFRTKNQLVKRCGTQLAVADPNMLHNEITEQIRRRAHELFVERDGKPGTELQDWLRAEEEIVTAREAIVDEASEESFPASDPPAY